MTEGTPTADAKAGARMHRAKRIRTQAPDVGDTVSNLHDLHIDPLTLPQARHHSGAEGIAHHHRTNGQTVQFDGTSNKTRISTSRNRTFAKEANKIKSTYNTRAKGPIPSNKQNGIDHGGSLSFVPSALSGTHEAAVTGLKTPLSGNSVASEKIEKQSNKKRNSDIVLEETDTMVGKLGYQAKGNNAGRTFSVTMSSPSMTKPRTSGASVGTMTTLPFGAGDVNLSNAPTDPIELAIWIAQQVKHFGARERSSVETDNDVSRYRLGSSSHVSENRASRNATDTSFGPMTEPPERRSLQASKKKVWREQHPERNVLSDIRSRISARAKKIYGPQHSAERVRYMETETKKRIAKHHAKENRAVFKFSDDASQALFPLAGEHSNSHLHAVGTLLFNSLFNVRLASPANFEAAEAFKSVIEDTEISSELFSKALRIMANDSATMSVIDEGLEFYKNSREKSGSTLGTQSFSTRSPTAGATLSSPMSHLMQQAKTVTNPTPKVIAVDNNAIIAAQTATMILQENPVSAQYKTPYGNPVEQNITKVDSYESPYSNPYISAVSNPDNYSSPYGNPPSVDLSTANSTLTTLPTDGTNHSEVIEASERRRSSARKVRAKVNVAKKPPPGSSLDIDKLLALANGGSLARDSDDEDTEEEMQHEGEDSIQRASRGEPSKLDEAVVAVVRHVGGDQAPALQSLLEQAKVSVNCIMPAEQSHAISELYEIIANRARFTYGGLHYNHQGQFGGAGVAHKGCFPRPVSAALPTQPTMPTPHGTVNVPTLVRARNREEARKIMTYGYPPLPGGQPGRR